MAVGPVRSVSLRIVLVLTTAVGLSLSGTQSATAASSGQLRNLKTKWCLDDSFRYGIRAHPCNGMSFQNWIHRAGPNGNWVLQNAETGRCLDDSVNRLQVLTCNGLPYQRWKAFVDERIAFTFESEETRRCLDDSINGLKTLDCNGTDFQRFYYEAQ